MPETYWMNGGDSNYSYVLNSTMQRDGSVNVKGMIEKVILDRLDVTHLLSNSNTFYVADLGCSVGPNCFISMQNVIEAVKRKYQMSKTEAYKVPEFQVFFNDTSCNDFNTLFTSLPSQKQYFAAGVPGSFHGRLFPESSLHFIHSAHALHWLSEIPKEVVDSNSAAWNKGRIHYAGANEQVGKAYSAQFAKDFEVFMNARAKELVVGGMMTLLVFGIADGISLSAFPAGFLFNFLGWSLMDMAKEGLVSEDMVDSFNLPIYTPCPKEIGELVGRNGSFSIERIEITPFGWTELSAHSCVLHLRAAFEGLSSKHFGSEVVDEWFARTDEKGREFSSQFESALKEATQIFIALIRK
ncbi:hypothetical protein K2173_024898 [Erythroxylum novogranatense]|uniref:S-adenosylmethionine-dependent methyltransferase n=1 Tax=Erythroxylum novogranatense TaxID=1862640 RepID=A0AAV8UCV6_9ROSI|nr:hypothetical protein K2173_024898 [Erythroxylum novogranatense]